MSGTADAWTVRQYFQPEIEIFCILWRGKKVKSFASFTCLKRVLLKQADGVISPPMWRVPRCVAFSLSGASVIPGRRKHQICFFSGD